jgi:RNA polymerase sigma factor (sigma-70 family)
MAGLSQLVHYVRRIVVPPESVSDSIFLDRFAHSCDEDAFASLVARHGPMVLRVCGAGLADKTSVDDCFQATFLVLARKARSIHRPVALSGWLHGVALRVCSEARRRAKRHALAPLPAGAHEVVDSGPDPLEQLTAREFLVAVHEEVQLLPESSRLPIILCCLENLSHAEAAQRLGCTPGSIKARLERGRARLSVRLARRGLTLSGALLTACVPAGAAQCNVLPGLRAATIKAALLYAAHADARRRAASAAALALADTVLGSMATGRTVAALTLLLAAAVGAGGLALLSGGGSTVGAGQRNVVANSPRFNLVQAQGKTSKDSRTWKEKIVLRGHDKPILGIAFSPDSSTLAVADGSSSVKLWDVGTGKEKANLKVKNLDGQVRSVAFSANDTIAAAVTYAKDGQPPSAGWIVLWNTQSHEVSAVLRSDKDLNQIAFSRDGKTLVSRGQALTIWDVSTRKVRIALPLRAKAMALSPDGGVLAAMLDADEVRLWDTGNGKEMARHKLPKAAPARLAFAPDGKTLAIASVGELELWDVNGNTSLSAKKAAAQNVIGGKQLMEQFEALAYAPSGKLLALGTGSAKAFQRIFGGDIMLVWDPAMTEWWLTLRGHNERVGCVEFSPDGKTLASGSDDKTVILWNVDAAMEGNKADQEGALAAIRKNEKAISNAQWRISLETGPLADPKDLSSMRKEPYGVKGSVLMDYRKKVRFRLQLDFITKWIRNPGDIVDNAMQEHHAFDGSTSMMMRRGKIGLVLPDDKDPPGRIEINKSGAVPAQFATFGGSAGYDFFPPYFGGVPLSRFLEERKPFSVTKENEHIWHIEMADPDEISNHFRDRMLRLDYDLSRGGLVTKAVWFLPKSKQTIKEMNMQPQKITDNVWVPETWTIHHPNWVPPEVARLTFSEVKINQKLEDEAFRLK